MIVPKQRSGSSGRGGANHRSSYKGFRASGGSVKPPKKGCLLILFLPLFLAAGAVTGAVHIL